MTELPIKHEQSTWDGVFYGIAREMAQLSKDPDRKVGALLVSADRRSMSPGYNGFPPEVPDLPSHLADKAFKLRNMLHAEHNCLKQSPFPTQGCSLYVTRFPCHECAKLIEAAGVTRVVCPPPDMGHRRWGMSWWLSRQLLWNAGIELVHY